MTRRVAAAKDWLFIGVLSALMTLVTVCASAQGVRPASMRALRTLGLDSIAGRVSVWFRPADRGRAEQLKTLLDEGLTFFEGKVDLWRPLRLAVLGREDWGKVTSLPYAFPNNSGAANLILAPVEYPPERRLDPTGRQNDLGLLFHEGGHLLTFHLLDSASLREPTVQARLQAMPAWYWEFVANAFLVAFLDATRPADATFAREYFHGLTRVSGLPYTHLDQMLLVMRDTTPGGEPYFLSEAGGRHFGWYQGVVGVMAEHVHRSQGLLLFDHVREVMRRNQPPRTPDIIADLDGYAPGLVAKLEGLGVRWR